MSIALSAGRPAIVIVIHAWIATPSSTEPSSGETAINHSHRSRGASQRLPG